jgi:four helix bundle protein
MEQRDRVTTFEDMKVWQEAHALVMRVFEQTPKLPPEQQDGLAMAMERTAVEVPRNIAEGFRRRGSRNKAHFYNIAQSTLEGLRYGIDFDDLAYRGDQVARMLDGLVRSMTRTSRDPRRGDRRPRRDEPSDARGGSDDADRDDDFADE